MTDTSLEARWRELYAISWQAEIEDILDEDRLKGMIADYTKEHGHEPSLGEELRMRSECKLDFSVECMRELATKWHEGAFRKGPEHAPYITHPAAVVQLLRSWGYRDWIDGLTLSVAWGHDLLEDTKVPIEEIIRACESREMGEMALAGITMLTFVPPEGCDDAEYDRAKVDYIRKIGKTAPVEILVVKIADRLCNTLDFLKLDRSRAAKYLALGEPLFARVDELKHADDVRDSIADVYAKVL